MVRARLRPRLRRALPVAICLAVPPLAPPPALADPGVVACSDFRSAWSGALAGRGLPRPSYGPADANSVARIGGFPGLEASLTCREGIVGHLELRSAEDAPAFERAVVSVLLVLDGAMSPEAAASTFAALKADTREGVRAAVISWGPYELTLSLPPARPDREFVLDLAEN